jgi:osmotically-inducible protein OsmY
VRSIRGRVVVSPIVALTLLLGSCATMSPWTDARIESEVKARLVAETDANLTQLGVVSRRAVVYLSGNVTTAEQRERAGTVAASVGGVQRVVNGVTVRAPGATDAAR